MKLNRRQFLTAGAVATAGLVLPKLPFPQFASTALAFNQSPGVRKFVQNLRGVFPLDSEGIPVAIPNPTNPGWWQPGVSHYL